MPHSITPFLMFEGRAEEAMNVYASVFAGSRVEHIERFGKDGPGKEGSVLRGMLSLAGQKVMFFDSPVHHAFSFTPASSLFVECASEAELDSAVAKLGEGGKLLMPPDNYGFSRKFAWLDDRWGVSWQLNWAG